MIGRLRPRPGPPPPPPQKVRIVSVRSGDYVYWNCDGYAASTPSEAYAKWHEMHLRSNPFAWPIRKNSSK